MPKTPPPIPNFDAGKTAFHAEAVRGYLHKCALDVLQQMREDGISHGEIAVMTGSVEFATQLWLQASARAGVPSKKARETLEAQQRRFWQKWKREEERGAAGVVAS